MKNIDYILLGLVLFLVIFGFVILSTATVNKSLEKFGVSYYYAKHQLIFGILAGAVFLLVLQKVNYHIWQKLSLIFFVFGLLLLFMVFIPHFQVAAGHSKRWINLFGFRFQPIEFFKIPLIAFLSAGLSKNNITEKQSFAFFLIVLLLSSVFLILQPDIGSLGLVWGISLSIFIATKAKWRYIIIVILLGLLSLTALIEIAPYRMSRFTTFLHPKQAVLGAGYQINQSLLAFGSGGIFGKGLGHSVQKYNYLPAMHTDSIFAIIGEEFGFVGTTMILLIFFAIAARGLRIARLASDKFGELMAIGISAWLILQSFINISAVTGLIPLTGIPLPFISYGSSAMVGCLAGLGILLNISRYI